MFKSILGAFSVHSRWKLAMKTAPFILAIVIAKFAAHRFGVEFLTLNPLFTAIISANIFLIGFLISGTLVDYKESERLPGELASSLETMADEALIIRRGKNTAESKSFLVKLSRLSDSLVDWFYEKERISDLLEKLRSLNEEFLAFESQTQANFIARLKQEQSALRRTINRIHTIRETSFLGTGYAIAEIITTILVAGFVFIRIDPFYESVFFVSFVSFILVYMIFFIKDLDNPFGYGEKDSLVEEVSLRPVLETQKRLAGFVRDSAE